MRAVLACAALVLGTAPAAAAHEAVPTPVPSPTKPAVPSAALSMGVTNDLDAIVFGEPVRYLITVRNDGTAAQRVTVRVAAPAMLDNVEVSDVAVTHARVSDARHAASVVAWPVVVPAHGQSTVELRARVAGSFGAAETVAVTACGLPDGAQVPTLCATDLDDLLVRRAETSAALPWVACGVALAVLVGGGAALWRRRRRTEPAEPAAPAEPATEAARAPAGEAAGEPAGTPTGKPTREPTEGAAGEPAGTPTGKPTREPTEGAAGEPAAGGPAQPAEPAR